MMTIKNIVSNVKMMIGILILKTVTIQQQRFQQESLP